MLFIRLRSFSRVLTSSVVNVQFSSKICTTVKRCTFQITDVSEVEKSVCLVKGDKSYFDFKELECNASAGQRLSHFVALMCEIFQMSEEEADYVVKYYPFLWKEFVHKSFSHLKSMGLNKDVFIQYPWLVSITPGKRSSKIIRYQIGLQTVI